MLQKHLGNQVTLLILKISCFHIARSEWKCSKIFHLTGLMDLSFKIYIYIYIYFLQFLLYANQRPRRAPCFEK